MGTLAITPANLPQLVLLPSRDADVIDDVIGGAVRRDAPSASRTRPPSQAQAAGGANQSHQKEKQRHGSGVQLLLDAVSPSPSHLWHFLDSLGATLTKPGDLDSHLRSLHLLHGFLRACSRGTFRETVKILLSSNSSQSQGSGSKPQLDLLKLTLPGSFQPRQLLASPEDSQQWEAAACSLRAYSKFLLQRLASSRFVFLPVSEAQAEEGQRGRQALEPQQGQSGRGSSDTWQLGQAYWAQQGAADLMQQLQALQRLQEGVAACGSSCGRWLQGMQEGMQAGSGAKPSVFLAWQGCTVSVMRTVLETLLQDSFTLFTAINYGFMELIERIGRIPQNQGLQALQLCRTSDAQGKAISELYVLLGSLGIGQGVDFPEVAVMGEGYISSLEQCIGDGQGQPSTPRSSSIVLFNRSGSTATQEPAPPPPPQPQPAHPAAPTYEQVVAAHQFEATSQALFGRYAPPPTTPLPALLPGVYPGGGVYQPQQQVSQIVPYNPSPVKAAWEAALDSALGGAHTPAASPNILHMPPATQFSGGFDQLLLDSLFEGAEAQRRASAAAAAQMQQQAQGDPFAASEPVAAPPYVQMAMRAREQMAVEMRRRMMAQHATLSSAWNTNGVGVNYGGNAYVPY